ncbi:hypothetical protein FNF27_02917 [Cafeteria roenbergensis]|uniref:Methyltransferase FkbM domain-containing protein n=1 Tax=Cafeteria roenbergensis TaxID=33653 RepID=A0A5A8ECB9_CAFRO|nr:hypothetical protein FNF27_02917 [Cafeteria roenbergensis]
MLRAAKRILRKQYRDIAETWRYHRHRDDPLFEPTPKPAQRKPKPGQPVSLEALPQLGDAEANEAASIRSEAWWAALADLVKLDTHWARGVSLPEARDQAKSLEREEAFAAGARSVAIQGREPLAGRARGLRRVHGLARRLWEASSEDRSKEIVRAYTETAGEALEAFILAFEQAKRREVRMYLREHPGALDEAKLAAAVAGSGLEGADLEAALLQTANAFVSGDVSQLRQAAEEAALKSTSRLQAGSGSDPILEYLVTHEKHVMEAFAFALDGEWCKAKMSSGLEGFAICTSPSGDDSVWMADVGANSGFYGTMSGTLGYPVVFVEPQPHCAQYIRKEAIASGIADRVQVANAFAGDRAVDAFDTVQRRTGCWGTFPYLTPSQLQGLASTYTGKPEYKDAVPVPMLTLDELVLGPAGGPQRDVVIAAMKVDVEGSEGAMLAGAARLLQQGRIYNLIMELNHNAWRLGKIDPFTEVLPKLVSLGKAGFRCRLSNYGGWQVQGNFDMSETRLSELLKEGWMGLDMWCSLAEERRHVPGA